MLDVNSYIWYLGQLSVEIALKEEEEEEEKEN